MPTGTLVKSACLFLAATGCAQPAPSARAEAIDSIYAEFSVAYDELDADKVANLYAPDALTGSPGGPGFVRGRAGARADFQRFFDHTREQGASIAIRFRFVERRRAPGLATDVGYFAITTTQGDSTRSGAGKFVAILAPDSQGQWRFTVDSYSEASMDAFNSSPPFEP